MFSIPKVMLVEEVMDTKYFTILEDSKIEDVLFEIIKNNVKTLLAIDIEGKLTGMISITDLSCLVNKHMNYKNLKVKDVVKTKVVSVTKGISLYECKEIMLNNEIDFLPVLEQENIIGTISLEHIRDYHYMLLEDYEMTLKYIISHIKEGIYATNKYGEVILWNKFMEDRYDINAKDIVGKHMNLFLKNTISEKVILSKNEMSDLYFNDKKENLYALVHVNPVFYNSEFIGVVGTEVDIIDAKNISIQLEKVNDTLNYLKDEVKSLSKGSFDNILGNSFKLEKSKAIAKQVAKTNSSILILGESGTGKEVFARAIHNYSEKKGQFIPVNCSAIPKELFESEFFGYEAGAFTGARDKGKMGLFELANNGTLFLDEIADLPRAMQAKLLRALQEKEIRRVGGSKTIKINPRIISATNKNLEELVREEKFREDLYYRLNVIEINIPPLRERKEDIGILTHSFLKEICDNNNKKIIKLDNEVIRAFQNYKWKGNIRELKNTIENIVVLSEKQNITTDDIPDYILESSNLSMEDTSYPLDLSRARSETEIKHINKALKVSDGNKSIAAKLLNIPRSTLYYKMDQYNIENN